MVLNSSNPVSDRGKQVQQLFQVLSKTLLAFKLYAPANRLRQDMFQALLDGLNMVLSNDVAVTISVDQSQLLYRNEVVLDLSDQEDSWVFALYRDGIRRLTLFPGITKREISQFLNIVGTNPQNERHKDRVDALWEADFEHIAHRAIDGFMEDDEDTHQREDLPSHQLQAQVRTHSVLSGIVGGEEEAPRLRRDEPGRIIQVTETVAAPLRTLMAAEPVVDSVDDLAQWGGELRDEGDDQLLTAVEDLLVYLLEGPAPPFSDDYVGLLLVQLIYQWLARSRFGVATEILTRLDRLRFDEPELTPLIQSVTNKSADNHALVLVCCGDSPLDDTQVRAAAVAYFRKYCSIGHDGFAGVTRAPLTHHGTEIAAELLADRFSASPQFWREHLMALPGGPLVGAIRALSRRPKEAAELGQIFWDAMDHEDESVRGAAIAGHPGPFEGRLRDQLVEGINDTSIAVRCAVAERLGRSGDGTVGPFLVDRIRRESNITPKELGRLVTALVTLGAERYSKFLAGHLDQLGALRPGLLGRETRGFERNLALSEALLTAVAESNVPAANDLLRETRTRARGPMKEVCDRLWRQVVQSFADTGAMPEVPVKPLSQVADVEVVDRLHNKRATPTFRLPPNVVVEKVRASTAAAGYVSASTPAINQPRAVVRHPDQVTRPVAGVELPEDLEPKGEIDDLLRAFLAEVD